ncbi:hypothetical protein A3A84_03200 [Candidatus Collierbacteria bacterium RIFCSPLOWO2_01_FULL_50_23]|uniref:Phosphatidylglycerol--prolipoprotein diacylglyceryl transferase n=2 Tax=Candidatus Collieribacteriota TaxID=1752725 RepID=A0A1F5EWH7_9BACT|nr:MAG: hypothetical protein A3D09_03130 [Candidatus Collierbacteria bacterium RIFCSPHIGHO2_02_FULL_49_10]OGD71937.1 MAG: hypothetical protein A2703_00955 [Candidatus Collierbacteria bacterium RIFCSPHIGHO2_01_FULL_50_25]OGD74801.1 MAG: hypothetical protein A3A84_03200 [Candidatus Collierbacteria bacterium RIFCSPLOWO2_01_FULL_50_23]
MSLNIFGIDFHIYGLTLGFAILAAFQGSSRLAAKRGVDKKIVESLFWWVVIGGILGARIYHVIDKWQEIYILDPQSVLYLWNGGLGIWGAILGGIASLLVYWQVKLKRRIDILTLMDIVLFGVPLGQAIGRWGNFFNNELMGKNGEPLFFYESSLDLILFVSLVWLSKKKVRPGVIAGAYLLGYGLIRLSLEQLRPENIIWKVGGIPAASLVSVLAVICGTFLIWRRRS